MPAVLALAAALLAPGCARRPPVVLLTVDALRADHLSVYGYPRRTDPHLAALAAEATVFERAYTPRAKTTPSYASLLTGTYPHRHGLLWLGQELASENLTLAEVLDAHGYVSRGFVSSTVMIARLSNLQQGFRRWDDRMPTREPNRANYERRAADTVGAMLDTLGKRGEGGVWFLHLIDPHSPYRAPPGWAGRFRGGSTRPIDPSRLGRAQRLEEARTLGDYVNAYDDEVAYADAQLGRVLDALRETGAYDRALILFTADHGESLGEHDSWFRHGENLHDECLRVPLIVKPPRVAGSKPPARWQGAVSLVDLFPTVLDYAGVSAPAGLDGVSLRPILEGRGGDPDRIVYSVKPSGRHADWAAHDRSGSLILSDCRGPVPATSCVAEYFDASTDPGHLAPRSDGAALEKLRGPLLDFARAAHDHHRPFRVRRLYRPADKDFVERFIHERAEPDEALSPREREALRSLGYL